MIRLSEKSIRLELNYHLAPKSISSIPKSRLYGWEADLLDVTHERLSHEYEIKCSRSDFLSDFKKSKHEVFRALHRRIKGGKLEGPSFKGKFLPNYFWFVTTDGFIDRKDIPEYAGWMEVRRDRDGEAFFEVHKKAPRLHSDKIDVGGLMDLLTDVDNRMWALIDDEMRREEEEEADRAHKQY